MTTLRLKSTLLDRAAFKSTGRLSYDPKRMDMNRNTAWWLVLNCDPGIADYYRWWINKTTNPLNLPEGEIKKPIWWPHISVIRGEKPRADLRHLWKKYEGEEVEFTYGIIPHNSGENTTRKTPDIHWYVNCECPRLDEIRRELGLWRGYEKYHLTVGKSYV